MITTQNCGLLIVDVQGKLAEIVADSGRMIGNIVKLTKSCQILSIPVVVLEQNPEGLGSTAPDITDCLEHYRPLVKHSFNGMSEPDIREHIQSLNKTHWLVVGIEAHICVYQTAKGLLAEDFKVELLSDCISSRLASNAELAVDNLRHAGAHITSVEMCLYELMKSSKTATFKEVLKNIK